MNDQAENTMLREAYTILGVDAGANEEDVSFATILHVNRSLNIGNTAFLHTDVLTALLAEDTIISCALEQKSPGVLETIGYTPEARGKHFSGVANAIVKALSSENGQAQLRSVVSDIADYKALEASEDLPASAFERAVEKMGVQLPEKLGQRLSRAANPAKSKEIVASTLRRTSLFEDIQNQWTQLKTMYDDHPAPQEPAGQEPL